MDPYLAAKMICSGLFRSRSRSRRVCVKLILEALGGGVRPPRSGAEWYAFNKLRSIGLLVPGDSGLYVFNREVLEWLCRSKN